MPELPEVETTVSSLKKKVLKRTFVRVWGDNDLKELEGKRIEKIRRRGKCIFFDLSSENVLFIHLRMTGHLLLGKWKQKNGDWESEEKILQERKNKFLRFIFFLDDGKQIALSDPRKFAKVSLITKEEEKQYSEKLGPEPLSLKEEDFLKLFNKKKGKIKPLLMNQFFLVGVGNIYAAEVLFKAGIAPWKDAGSLSIEEKKRIYSFLKEILEKSIKLKGDSTSDYRLISGEKGGYQNEHLVYNRKGLPCFSCKDKIERVKVGGRGTYYCPTCQKI